MANPVKRRAKNSLSRKKFIDRLDKELPIFVSTREANIHRLDGVRNLHWVQFTSCNDGAEFIDATWIDDDGRAYRAHRSLRDMNVKLGRYSVIFAFRTYEAAKEYVDSR